MSSAPYPRESLEEYRSRRKAEMAGGPTPDAGFEAQKAKVAAQHQRVSRQAPAGKSAVNLNTAAEDEESVASTHKKLAGGVKTLDPDKVKAADSDKDWAKMSPADQQAIAKGKSGAVHTTETSGPHQPAMAAAMEKAGLNRASDKTTPAPVKNAQAKAPAQAAVSASTAAQNNMGTPRTQDNGASTVAGRTAGGSQAERDQARAAATKGTRGGGKSAEAKAASRSASPRSAASGAPAGTSVKGPQFSRIGDHGAEASSAPGRDWLTPSQISGKPSPVSNAAPVAPTPAASPSPSAPSTPTSQPSEKPYSLDKVIGSKPAKGVTPAHMASSAPGRDWLTPQAANKAKAKASAKAPREAVAEQPALAPSPGPRPSAPANPTAPSAPSAPAMSEVATVKRDAREARQHAYNNKVLGPPGPRLPQRTPMSPQMDKAAPSAPAEKLGGNTGPLPSVSPEGTAPAPRGGRSSGQPSPGVDSGPVVRASGPTGTGRTGSSPRSTEVGGGRGGVHANDHSNAVGGDNYGSMTTNHNTYNVNYGHIGGSQGNVDHASGGSRSSGSGGGGGGGGNHNAGSGGHGFNAWYHDSTGHHDLRSGIDHVTGRTDGSKHGRGSGTLGGGGSGGTLGGSQRPLRSSPRAGGGQAAQNPTGTGTTSNWQGPATTHTASASGNGTSLPAHPQTAP